MSKKSHMASRAIGQLRIRSTVKRLCANCGPTDMRARKNSQHRQSQTCQVSVLRMREKFVEPQKTFPRVVRKVFICLLGGLGQKILKIKCLQLAKIAFHGISTVNIKCHLTSFVKHLIDLAFLIKCVRISLPCMWAWKCIKLRVSHADKVKIMKCRVTHFSLSSCQIHPIPGPIPSQ